MKPVSRLVLLLLFSITFSIARAQYVTIPDTNFVTWLQANGYASCMVGNQLDTTCNAVVTATSVNVLGNFITDLTGITYFDSLTELVCQANLMTELPPLPAGLRWLISNNCPWLHSLPPLPATLYDLEVTYCDLDSLPTLPAGLDELFVSFNNITSLPSLPSSIRTLGCGSNLLTALPTLPPGLQMLNCSDNMLTSLAPLPVTLVSLNTSNNPLHALPALPNGLFHLFCGFDSLLTLPALPANLRVLSCPGNPGLPLPVLPDSLDHLDCSDNQLTSLPQLPPTIDRVYCSRNLLTALPPLPDTLESLRIDSNLSLGCIPAIHWIDTLVWNNTNILCRGGDVSVGYSYPAYDSLPYCDLNNANGCDVFWNLRGTVYTDTNANCLPDTSELRMGLIKINLLKNGTIVKQTFSDPSGNFDFDTDTGIYVCTIDTNGSPFHVNCPATGYTTDTITLAQPLSEGADLSLQLLPGCDLGIWSVLQLQQFRPGQRVDMKVLAGDLVNAFGTHCAAGTGGQVKVVIGGAAQFDSIAPGALTPAVIGDTLIYTVTDFGTTNYEQDFNFRLAVDTLAQLGTFICLDVTVTSPVGDNHPENNHFVYCDRIFGSYDPNDKAVSPAGTIDTSIHWLTYTIRFQNTGTAPAERVRILDTLDGSLDEGTLQLLAFSHTVNAEVAGNLVRFSFPEIQLPDSGSDEPGSHGFVQYRIRLKDNLALGTVIENTAYIYFDYNAPVMTNTVSNDIALPAGTMSPSRLETGIRVFPNPVSAGSPVRLELPHAKGELTILDMRGRLVFRAAISQNAGSQWIRIADPGVYQCIFTVAEGRGVAKLVVW